MQYKATARGHDGKQIREIGEVFVFDGKQGSWMERINDDLPQAEEVELTKKTPKKL